MPLSFDLSIEQLKPYQGKNPCPSDFDSLWDKGLAEMYSIDPKVELIAAEFQAPNVECFHLFFTGVGDARVHAKLLRPVNAPSPHPAVLLFHGYTGDAGDWFDKLSFVSAGFTVAALDCRGQAGFSGKTARNGTSGAFQKSVPGSRQQYITAEISRMKNNVQLITYADRLGGGDLKTLHRFLKGPLAGLFGGIHILPFYYPIHGTDAGFDPVDHTRIDPCLGSWADIKDLGQDVDLMADLIVNHVSSSSPQFLDYSEKGDASIYKNMFLTMTSIFPNGATEADLMTIYRPRPGLPFSYTILKNNQKRLLWTTFSKEQIDLNVTDPQGQAYLQSVLQTLHKNGIRMVRLDAVGYAIKKAGSSCFMIPETFDFIEYLADQAAALDIEVLVEIHSHFRRQIEIAHRVDCVYDFALPPLVLHAIFNHTAHYLKQWLEISPRNAITVLDTHDGIGVIDIGADNADSQSRPGIIPPEELDALVEKIHTNSNGQSRLATGVAASNLDLYQVNCTFYDALGRNDRDYLLARAIQFFAPGVPQVYYVGLLAGENDMTLLAKSGVGRDINRHYYTTEEIHRAIQRPVVQSLFELIRFRNHHPAFNGSFSMPETRESGITMRWDNGVHWAMLEVDFASGSYSISNSPFELLEPK